MSGPRELTDAEVAALGLPPDGPANQRELSPEELKTLGLPLNPGGDISGLESAALGAGQGMTLGFSDEAAAAMDWLAGKMGVGNPLATSLGNPETYQDFREFYRRRMAEAQRQNPKSYGAGQLAGAVAVPGSGLKAVVSQAAAQGLGQSESDLTEGDVGGAVADTAKGAAIGAAGFGAGKALGVGMSKAAPALKRALRNYSIEKGRKALTSGADQLAQKNPVSEAAVQEALESGAIRLGGSTAGTAKRLEDLAQARGTVYGEILDDLEASGVRGPAASEVARRLWEAGQREAQQTTIEQVPRTYLKAARSVAAKESDEFAPGATLGLRQAEALKRSLQEEAKAAYQQLAPRSVGKAKMDAARIVREANEEAVSRAAADAPVGSPVREMGEAFEPVKRRLAATLEAKAAADKGLAKESTRTSDSASRALSAAAHGVAPGQAAVLGILQDLYRGRGASTMAAGAYKLARGRAIDEGGELAGEYLPASVRGLLPAEDIEEAKRRALIEYLRGGK